jgi:uncharacterized cupredoxin-like copper-binding protein
MRRVRQSSIVAVLAVVALSLLLGACGGDDDDSGGNGERGKTVDAVDGKVTVVGEDIYFVEERINAEPGPLEITLRNEGAQRHTFVIDDPEFKLDTGPGESDTGTVELTEPKTYAYYCDVPGHRQTMNGELVVQ